MKREIKQNYLYLTAQRHYCEILAEVKGKDLLEIKE